MHLAGAQIVYDESLKCSKCILGGYNFCIQSQEDKEYSDENELASYATKCCADTSCSEYTDPNWSCSAAYADYVYALTMCPFKKDKCGETKKLSFDRDLNATKSIQVNNLTQGESCAYEIKSNCNSPAFRTTDSFMMDDDNVEIYFIEYEKAFINATEVD